MGVFEREGVRRRLLALAGVVVLTCGAGIGFGPSARAQAAARQQPVTSSESTTPVNTDADKRAEVKDENEAYLQSPIVQRFGAALGMKPAQAATVFTLFNFFVLAAAVGYLLLKNLPKTFRSRSSAIQKRLVEARSATEEATSRLNSVEARLSKLDEQIAGMQRQAEADSVRDEQRIKATVEDEKAKIVAAAEAEIQSATVAARREIQRYAAELAVEQAARKLVVTAETDRLLVESFAQRLTAMPGGGSNGSAN